MKVKYNEAFLGFLKEYNLPTDFSFSCNIPREIRKILNSEILQTKQGITLKTFNKLHSPIGIGETISTIEYDENHFHVDWFASSEEDAFKLGIKTLVLLAEKFAQQQISDIRFDYSFQSPELGRKQAEDANIHEDGDEYFISDRLTFYRRRENDEVVSNEQFNNPYFAQLIIDI